MPTVLEDLNTSVPTVAALQNSIATFTLIASGIRTEINEFLSDTYGVGKTLKDWELEISNGIGVNGHGWVADRTRFLNSPQSPNPVPWAVAPKTIITAFEASGPVGSFGNKTDYNGSLSEWSIYPSLSPNPGSTPGAAPVSETIDAYGGGSLILSAIRTAPVTETYTMDRYTFFENDYTFKFVCKYLNETPVNVALGDQCRGLIYSLSAMQTGTTSMKNQITFTRLKQKELSRLL